MAFFGIFKLIWLLISKLIIPILLVMFGLYIFYLMVGGVVHFVFGILCLPFRLFGFKWYKATLNGNSRQSNYNSGEYQKEYKPKDEPKVQADMRYELYDLLGVNFNATRAEIRAAFKNKMMMNHPDKLSTLDPELQRFAMERTIAIKDAYERLSGMVH